MFTKLTRVVRPRVVAVRTFSSNQAAAWPSNVGILAADFYIPDRCVAQKDLESFDGVSQGKYEIGLELKNMSFTDDCEDIYSMALNATKNLLTKYNIDPKQVGRLDVGTETLVDKSKSIKSALMPLFEGNPDIEGVDSINACYGGTAALFNTLNWVESSSWDGRYAIVVCGDIAVYEKGPARPTGGAGVVAMLIGPNAPIVVERGARATYVENAYDFYKPQGTSEYPTVDGPLSQVCYLRALDSCYDNFRTRFQKTHGQEFSLAMADYALFHCPFGKMVRKSFSRVAYLDYIRNPELYSEDKVPRDKILALTQEQSWHDRESQKIFDQVSKAEFAQKVQPSLLMPQNVGNTYTASLYTSLLSLIANKSDEELLNKRLMMFSYGSGLVSSLWTMRVQGSVEHIRKNSDVINRLNSRSVATPEEYTAAMDIRREAFGKNNYTPVASTDNISPGNYYLKHIDDMWRRSYEIKSAQ